jgi:hypothetical protein
MHRRVSIMERRLFYTEGTEEFRKSLDELAPYDREQILSKELPGNRREVGA